MSYQVISYINTEKELPTDEKRLSICHKSNGFSFAVTTTQGFLVKSGDVSYEGTTMSDLMGTIRGVVADCELPTIGVAALELVIPTQQFVLVPEHLYEAENDRRYLETVCRVEPGATLCSDYIEQLKAWSVFEADNTVLSAYRITLPGIKVRCQFAKLASADLLAKSANGELIAVNMRPKAADIVVMKNGTLQLANTYVCNDFSDALYFALDIVNKEGLDAGRLQMLLSGEVTLANYNLMRHYFADVKLNNGRELRYLNAEFQHLHSYRYVMVLN
ncbi:MAG: DUF3822 family protein [Bacteroidales bacterium]|nr:DUF3822 family protein [Bacteroidales bacterium]